uniref:Uncharacterized protein n=1 Tax=Candidatus Kentrum sp. FW TaxID=2126338 RepID=A0A450TKU7_9GAMM|nr:MAG: hypothetical protein BECKFW1821B_GA0114236_11421 [Candidatus Kentron sp. FW]
MQVIQFDARIHDGVIDIPPQHRHLPKENVKVILIKSFNFRKLL